MTYTKRKATTILHGTFNLKFAKTKIRSIHFTHLVELISKWFSDSISDDVQSYFSRWIIFIQVSSVDKMQLRCSVSIDTKQQKKTEPKYGVNINLWQVGVKRGLNAYHFPFPTLFICLYFGCLIFFSILISWCKTFCCLFARTQVFCILCLCCFVCCFISSFLFSTFTNLLFIVFMLI